MSPLLSRFDLIFSLSDKKDESFDKSLSSFILNGHVTKKSNNLWQLDKLRTYISYCKKFKPELSAETQEILASYYKLQRSVDGSGGSVRTTIRLLESLVRLSIAHARLLNRNEVLPLDAAAVIILFENSLMKTHILDSEAQISWKDLTSIDDIFRQQCNVILRQLSKGHQEN